MRRLMTTKTSWVEHLAFSPDGRLLAASSLGSYARVWDVTTGKPAARLAGSGSGGCSHFLPGGRLLVAAFDCPLRVFDLAGGGVRNLGNGVNSPADGNASAVSPDGLRLAFVRRGDLAAEVACLDVADGRELWRAELPTTSGDNAGVRFAPDGRSLVAVGLAGVVGLDAATGATLYRFGPWEVGVRIPSCSFQPDGTALAIGVLDAVLVLSLPDGREIGRPGGFGYGPRPVYTPDGRALAVIAAGDETVQFFDADSLRALHAFAPEVGFPKALAFSPDGMLAAAGGSEGRIALWDMA